MIGGFMNVLKKVLLFIVLALAIAWPLQPQRAGRQDRERELKPPADTNRASALAAPAQWARGYFYNSNLSCYATVIKQTTEGGYIMAGYEYYVDMTSRAWSAFVVKLNADGIVEWQTRLENSETSYGMWPIPLDVFQAADGGYIIGGAGWGYWVIKLSASGAFQWQRHKIVWGYPECFMLTRDGGFILAGYYYDYSFWVIKLGWDGEIEWQKKYHQEGRSERARAIAQTMDGGYIIVGQTDAFSDNNKDLNVLKLDAAGGIEWQRCYSASGRDLALSVQSLPDGSFIVAGSIYYEDWTRRPDGLALKLGPDGSVIWCTAYTGSPYSVSKICQLQDGGFLLAWPTSVLRLSAYGDIVWQRAFEIGIGFEDLQPTADGGFIFAGGYHGQIAAFKTNSLGMIAGCSLIRDSGFTAFAPTLTAEVWSPTVTSLSAVSDPLSWFEPQAATISTETICLPYFELTIAAGPGGTTKPEPATHAYAGGTSVKVYALPDERHIFSYWSGDVPENKRRDNPVRIDMDDNKSIKANFARPNFQLTISAGTGGTTDPTPGVHTYAGDTVVKIEALPDASHFFTFWTGDVSDAQRAQNPTQIEMDSDKAVGANFLTRIFPPLDLRVETQENRSLFTVEHINILTWRPNSMNTGIIKYGVYELRAGNLVLLAEPAVGTETYWHRGVKEGNTYTYVVKAVGADGREGEPASVTVTVS